MKEFLYNFLFLPLPIFWFLVFIILYKNKINIIIYLKFILIVFYIILTPFFSNLLQYPLTYGIETYKVGDKISYVLVPTAGIYRDAQLNWHPSTDTVLRVKKAEKIAKKLKVPLIVSGGIIGSNNTAESMVAKNIIKYKNVFYEKNSKNSYETSKFLKRFILQNNIENILPGLLVTSPRHNLRMSLALSSQEHQIKTYRDNIKLEINFRAFLPDARAMHNKVIYEYLALIKYFVLQYI